MSADKDYIERYRRARAKAGEHRLANTICVAADLILKLESGYYAPEQTDDVLEMVEALIRRYAEGRRDEAGQ